MLITSDLRDYWLVRLLGVLALIKSVSSQGLACYKCMTTDSRADSCQDPFSSLLNPIQINCQVGVARKDLTHPVFSRPGDGEGQERHVSRSILRENQWTRSERRQRRQCVVFEHQYLLSHLRCQQHHGFVEISGNNG